MYNINLDISGVAKVHRADSPIRSCQPQTKRPENGEWLLNQSTLPPNGSTLTRDGRNYTVEYCMDPRKGCIRNP